MFTDYYRFTISTLIITLQYCQNNKHFTFLKKMMRKFSKHINWEILLKEGEDSDQNVRTGMKKWNGIGL